MFEDYKFPNLFNAAPDVYPDKDPLNMDLLRIIRPIAKFLSLYFRPIFLEGGPEDVADRALVARNQRMVWDMGMEMIKEGLERRKSVWFG